MIKVATEKLNEWEADPAALQADADAVQHVADEIAGLDFTGTSPALEEKAQEAVALLAGLHLVHKMLLGRSTPSAAGSRAGRGAAAPPPLFPTASPSIRGGSRNRSRGNRSRTSSTASRGGAGGSKGEEGTVEDRLRRLSTSGAGVIGGGFGSKGSSAGSFGRNSRRTGGGFSTGSRRNPFNSNAGKLKDNFYLELPFPWNALPSDEATTAQEVFKIAAVSLPKFNGTHSGYSAWRNSFVPCVHLTNIDVTHKCLLLRASMEVRTARMREFVDGLVNNEDGYREAILKLEDRYGGDEALLLARQEALLAVPELKQGEYRTVELLHSCLNTFLVEWAGVNGAEMDETESLAFYTLIMSKIEPTYTLRYLDWIRSRELRKGLHSLHDWLAEQLKDHRAVELYHRRRTLSARAARQDGGSQTGRRNSVPPPSHLDRNYPPRQRTFLTIDEEWEELGGGELHLGEEEVFSGESHFLAKPEVRPPLKCPLCNTPHPLAKCNQYQKMTPKQRKDFLVQEGRCFLCFQKTHPVTRCRFRYNCGHCGGKHHTMIHGADEEAPGASHFLANEGDVDLEGAAEMVNFGLFAGGDAPKKAVSLRTITVYVRNPTNGKHMLLNALLDDGCTGAGLLSAEAAEELGLQGPTYWASTEGVGGRVTNYRTFLSRLEIRPPGGGCCWPLGVQIMKSPAGTYAPVDWTEHQHRFPHLQHLPLHAPVQRRAVDLLIGSRVPWLSAALQERRGEKDGPIARLTPLGWTVAGPTHPTMPTDRSSALTTLLASTASSLPLKEEEWPQSGGVMKIEGRRPVQAEDVSDRQLHRLVQRMLQEEEQAE